MEKKSTFSKVKKLMKPFNLGSLFINFPCDYKTLKSNTGNIERICIAVRLIPINFPPLDKRLKRSPKELPTSGKEIGRENTA